MKLIDGIEWNLMESINEWVGWIVFVVGYGPAAPLPRSDSIPRSFSLLSISLSLLSAPFNQQLAERESEQPINQINSFLINWWKVDEREWKKRLTGVKTYNHLLRN